MFSLAIIFIFCFIKFTNKGLGMLKTVNKFSNNISSGTKIKSVTKDALFDLINTLPRSNHADIGKDVFSQHSSYALGMGPCLAILIKDLKSNAHYMTHKLFPTFTESIVKSQKKSLREATSKFNSDNLKAFIIGGESFDWLFFNKIYKALNKDPKIQDVSVIAHKKSEYFCNNVAYIAPKDELYISTEAFGAKDFIFNSKEDIKKAFRKVKLSKDDKIV